MKSVPAILLCLSLSTHLAAQTDEDKNNGRFTAKELSIPTSPIFDLMGVAPSQVARTSDIKDFKVDWSFKSWRLNPNLAIQGQPVWEIFYNRKSLEKYQRSSRFSRTLASLDVSMGTIQQENGDRRIGAAAKINLYKQKDPLMRKGMYDDVERVYSEELAELKRKETNLLKTIDTTTNVRTLKDARESLKSNDEQILSFHNRRNAAIREKAAAFVGENWNASFVDLAYGQVYTYKTDSAGSLKSLQINRNTGKGLWLNAGFGVGKRLLISGLIRTTDYKDEIGFTMTDTATGVDTSLTTTIDNNIISLGLNFRYGSPVYNFFFECFYETKATKTAAAAVSESFIAPPGQEIVQGSPKWDIVSPITYSIGGDWRISRNLMINYGIRCLMDKQFRTTAVVPVASISCMMR